MVPMKLQPKHCFMLANICTAQRTAEVLLNQNRVEEEGRKAQPLAQLGTGPGRLEAEYLRSLDQMDDVRLRLGYYIPA